eukprot:1737544-Amphidinium_carterae.1
MEATEWTRVMTEISSGATTVAPTAVRVCVDLSDSILCPAVGHTSGLSASPTLAALSASSAPLSVTIDPDNPRFSIASFLN